MIRVALSLVLVATLLLPVTAMADDLDEMLEDAQAAEFHGVGVVMCTWGQDSAAASYEVTRSDGMSMIHGPDGDLMSYGAMSATRADGGWSALQLGDWTAWAMSDRYSVAEGVPVERLGRSATEITIMEGDLVRARLVVDDASTVPLLTQVFDGNGGVFRMAAMIEFEAGHQELAMPPDLAEPDMMMPAPPSARLPAETHGYSRTDSYSMDETLQVFYTDGLFSFSVFELRRGQMPGQVAGATPFVVDDELYRRIVTPSVVWIQWDAPDNSYLLVGDLPPDHLMAVLADLPEPGRRHLFVRLWRRLFG